MALFKSGLRNFFKIFKKLYILSLALALDQCNGRFGGKGRGGGAEGGEVKKDIDVTSMSNYKSVL